MTWILQINITLDNDGPHNDGPHNDGPHTDGPHIHA